MLDDDPAYAEYNAKVLKTIQEIRDKGKAKRTIKSVFSTCGDLTEKPI